MPQAYTKVSKEYQTQCGVVRVSLLATEGGYAMRVLSSQHGWSMSQNFWSKPKALVAYEDMCAAAALDALPANLWTYPHGQVVNE